VSGKLDSCKAAFAESDTVHCIAPDALYLLAHSVLVWSRRRRPGGGGGGGGGELTRGRRAATSLARTDHGVGDGLGSGCRHLVGRRHPALPGCTGRPSHRPFTAATAASQQHGSTTRRPVGGVRTSDRTSLSAQSCGQTTIPRTYSPDADKIDGCDPREHSPQTNLWSSTLRCEGLC